MNLVQQFGPLVGRILLAALFIPAGLGKIPGFEGTVGYIASRGCRCPSSARRSRSSSRSASPARCWSAGARAGRR
jgi:uncharacterized membrane protein YphA (DoxX/SURF4 family)